MNEFDENDMIIENMAVNAESLAVDELLYLSQLSNKVMLDKAITPYNYKE